MDIPFALLHLSAVLTCILFILMLRMKNKKALHYSALGLVLVVFLWCVFALVNIYVTSYYHYNGMLFAYLFTSINGFLSVTLFLFGFSYAYQESKWRSRVYWILLVPVVGAALIMTNSYHHLAYIYYSNIDSESVFGPYLKVFPYFAYVMVILGMFFLVRSSVKNSGFFSRQSLLIIIGILFPLVVDVILFLRVLSFPRYYEAVSFSVTVICIMISIFRFGLFRIAPIALQTIVDHISDGYIVINERDEVIDFNRSLAESFKGIADISRRENLREFLRKLDDISKIKSDEFMQYIKSAEGTKRSVSCENQYSSKDTDKTLIIDITPIFSQDLYKGAVILLKDITEQRKSYETIRKTQMALIESEHLASLGQLVGGIAHNLKTPIMSISGGLEGLTDLIDEYDESVGDESITVEDHHEIAGDMRVWIGKMKDYTAYMSDIISAVKGQAVQLTSSTTDSFTLRELIKRVDILMNHELKKFGCRLKVNCAIDKDTDTKGEINSFVQVINNLIINAIEAYEGREGVIEFNISQGSGEDERMLLFEVKDYGSGMTDEVKSKLFKEMITTKAKNGTGLGLYMSYSTITGRFGGRMWFESVHGMGTSFYIMIPAV
jgi:two-component system sensor histidine kinase HupT/HoxJ